MKNQLYSFDIYDTLITRKTATPEGIFALMQEKLINSEEYVDYPERLIHNFYLLRIQAEKVARNTYIVGEIRDITLNQIYECIRLMWDLKIDQVEKMMALEVTTEMENSLPILDNIEKLRMLKKKGERVVLISNMYLKEEDIRNILLQVDPVFQGIKMYISGDLGKTKGTRTLYHYVRQQEKVEFADWHHYGDNRNLDVEIPLSMGIQAEHVKPIDLLEWEEELLHGKESNPELQLLLGVSRGVSKGENTSFSYQVGAGYSAEILLPYVLWVLQESLKKGIVKLFFVARDGYILKKIADILIEKYNYPITTTYLYGSRKAWRLPSISSDRFDLQEFLLWNYPGQIYSYQRIAEILGLTMEELKIFLPFIEDSKQELSKALVQEVLKILQEQQTQLADSICRKQKRKREAAVNYLFQEIGKEEQNFAFVDLIGSGYTQRCLAELMKAFYNKPIRTFFYRLDSCKSCERNINYVFFPNRIKMGNVIEVLCSAPHGQTNGYDFVNGFWVPVLGKDEGEKLEEYGFDDYVKGIEDYTKKFAVFFPQGPLELRDLSVLKLYFEYMSEAGNQKLYDYVADMPYGITGQEKTVTSFAPRLTNKDLRQIYFWHKGEPIKKYYMGYSLDFSLMRLSEKQKKQLAVYNKWSEKKIIKWVREHFFQSEIEMCNSRYDLIADQIILYGAGKKGQLLKQQLTSGKRYHADIIMWVDKNYQKYRENGLNVQSPEDIIQANYKQIVIGVADKHLAGEIKEFLVANGMAPAKILWICPDSKIN